ncbi:sporulation YhaL family protein [Peribacillus kribbensis]|uniref:sporulation YhaL family protein n=1 Tax=Peribacillus kribbensis TaxID=356658 RepID=UPI0003F501DA|nr:sporulation YhaL family protein [Peribacillus kribbensis]
MERGDDMPVWVWFVIAGIASSAFMTLKTALEDKRLEMAWIEEEGMKYIERMEEEKRKRNEGAEEEPDTKLIV